MATISYAITVCNEVDELKKLLPLLIDNIRDDDEVVILYDEKNGKQEIIDYLTNYKSTPNLRWFSHSDFNGDFAQWKNRLNSYCEKDWIFQLDADETIEPLLIHNLSDILDNNAQMDLIFVPRINIVDGLTTDHIQKWGWQVNENGWVNFPDHQTRIYKNTSNIQWVGKVHERITGFDAYTSFPADVVYCIKHVKTISRQEKQNAYYETL